ncbi:hypothetical protein DWX45_17905 [Erysipelotrichaceae bacterium AF19-24AC]|nr:hypothetical protein DWX45_17905 [Erysipelotrichaceae bacterium AF19-24AC]
MISAYSGLQKDKSAYTFLYRIYTAISCFLCVIKKGRSFHVCHAMIGKPLYIHIAGYAVLA